MKKVIKWTLGVAVFCTLSLFAVTYLVFGLPETNVAYQSSNGEWADGEILFKGRGFKSVIFGYELYKIVCNIPDEELQRITKKPKIWNIEWWFDDFGDPKWLVPYSDPHPNLNGEKYFRPPNNKNCSNKGVMPEEMEMAERNTDAFIVKLRQTHNK